MRVFWHRRLEPLSRTTMTQTKTHQGRRERRGPRLCKVTDCGRPRYARALCQTHHRQLMTTGELKTIRPYRERSPGTVKCSGLRLTSNCADELMRFAKAHGLSQGAAIA